MSSYKHYIDKDTGLLYRASIVIIGFSSDEDSYVEIYNRLRNKWDSCSDVDYVDNSWINICEKDAVNYILTNATEDPLEPIVDSLYKLMSKVTNDGKEDIRSILKYIYSIQNKVIH